MAAESLESLRGHDAQTHHLDLTQDPSPNSSSFRWSNDAPIELNATTDPLLFTQNNYSDWILVSFAVVCSIPVDVLCFHE